MEMAGLAPAPFAGLILAGIASIEPLIWTYLLYFVLMPPSMMILLKRNEGVSNFLGTVKHP